MFTMTTRLLGYLSGGLGAVALAAGAFAGIQTHRLHETQGTVAVLKDNLVRADEAFGRVTLIANERAEALKSRDVLLAEQSASIDAIAAQRDTSRRNYLAGILQAETGAKVHETRAAELTRAPTIAPDDRCEAARALIESEMLNVR